MKSETSTNDGNLKLKTASAAGDGVSVIWTLRFGFVLDFDIRISNYLKETKPFSRNI